MALAGGRRQIDAMDFSLLEFVPDAMVIVDQADGRIAYLNRVAEELFGYRREELLGQLVEVLLPARFRQAHQGHRDGYGAAPRARPMGLGLDLSGLRKGGEEFPAEVSLSPLTAEGRQYAITAIRDMSERKKIEERARLYRQAQEEVRRRDEFLSIASHELKTPVAALQLQLQMLHRAAERQASPLPRPRRASAIDSCSRMGGSSSGIRSRSGSATVWSGASSASAT